MWIFLLLFAEALLLPGSLTRRLPDVYWNSSNPIFLVSNTDHVMAVRLLDRMTIVCPGPSPPSIYEFSKLYAVSREEYNDCELGSGSRLVGVCGNPRQPSSISIVFRDFSPLPGALEFRPGQNYYITTTSDGSETGVDNKKGGLCYSKHMKIKLEVQPDERERESTNDYEIPIAPDGIRHPPSRISTVNMLGTTPMMYMIHTSDEMDEQGHQGNHQPFVKDGDDDEDDGIRIGLNPLMIVFGMFAVDFAWRRLRV